MLVAGKYKLGARAVKYKLGTRTGGPWPGASKGPGAGKHKDPMKNAINHL